MPKPPQQILDTAANLREERMQFFLGGVEIMNRFPEQRAVALGALIGAYWGRVPIPHETAFLASFVLQACAHWGISLLDALTATGNLNATQFVVDELDEAAAIEIDGRVRTITPEDFGWDADRLEVVFRPRG